MLTGARTVKVTEENQQTAIVWKEKMNYTDQYNKLKRTNQNRSNTDQLNMELLGPTQ